MRNVRDLLKALEKPDPKVKIFACESLGALGPEAKEAAPQLRKVAAASPAPIRYAAHAALAKIEPPSEPAP